MRNRQGSVERQGTDPGACAIIDENLRRVYAELEEGDMPDRFHRLLEQLREAREQQS
jgi:hypothetical protein